MSYDSKKLPKLEYDGIYDVEDTLSDDDGEEYDVQIGDDVAKRLGDTDDIDKQSTSKRTPKVVDLDKGINDEYKHFLYDKGLRLPSKLLSLVLALMIL